MYTFVNLNFKAGVNFPKGTVMVQQVEDKLYYIKIIVKCCNRKDFL